MVKFVYSMLLIVMAGGVGLAAVCGWLNLKLYRMDKDKRRRPLGLLLLGTVVANSILVYALIRAGTTTVNLTSIAFALARIVSTVALAWLAASMIADLALGEALKDGYVNGGNWVRNMERRLTAEEARNTDIEDFARRESERQDRSDQRADDTEEHA